MVDGGKPVLQKIVSNSSVLNVWRFQGSPTDIPEGRFEALGKTPHLTSKCDVNLMTDEYVYVQTTNPSPPF